MSEIGEPSARPLYPGEMPNGDSWRHECPWCFMFPQGGRPGMRAHARIVHPGERLPPPKITACPVDETSYLFLDQPPRRPQLKALVGGRVSEGVRKTRRKGILHPVEGGRQPLAAPWPDPRTQPVAVLSLWRDFRWMWLGDQGRGRSGGGSFPAA